MRKFFLFALIVVFSLMLVSAGSTCSQSGYKWCYENSNTYGSSTAIAKIYLSDFQDESGNALTSSYVTKGLYINVGGYFGKQGVGNLYFYNNINSWDSVSCGANGCNGQYLPEGRKKLASIGEKYIGCPAFVSWAIDSASNGDWSWVSASLGWLGSGNCFDYMVVECNSNSDCNSGYLCDKSGTWQNWKCVQKECDSKSCDGTSYIACENFKKVNKGITKGECGVECLSNEDKCDESTLTYYACENFKWVSQGEQIGKCGVNCKSGVKEYLNCSEGYISDQFVSRTCTNGKWVDSAIQTCSCIDNTKGICAEGYECKNSDCVKTTNWLQYILIGGALVIILAFFSFIIWLLIMKKFRK